MYSVVLMMAMTGGGDVQAGLFHNGCNGGVTVAATAVATVAAPAASTARPQSRSWLLG